MMLDATARSMRGEPEIPPPRYAPPAPPCAPLLKWVGGKTALLPALHAQIPRTFAGRYFEPFAGGAALYFSLAPEHAGGAVLSDMNTDLITCYRVVANDTERVIRRLRWMEREYRSYGDKRWHRSGGALKSFYYAVRDEWNKGLGSKDTDVQRAARFLFLNRTCWNGVWRVNRNGQFNVPQGNYDPTRTICDADKIRAAAARLRQATVLACNWTTAIAAAKEGDLVYFDPPYVPLSETARFTSYTADGFGRNGQEHLAQAACELVERGVHVIASNSNTPLVRQLYRSHFTLKRVSAPRAINCKSDRRGAVRELLLVGRR